MAVMYTDNIIATLESHAKLNGNKIAFEYLGRQSGGIQSLTYADLNERVQHQAQILMNIVDSGDRAVLLFEPGLAGIVWLRRRKNRLMNCIANMVVMRLQKF